MLKFHIPEFGFRPILAGATLSARLMAAVGAMLGIAATALICTVSLYLDPALPWLVAPIGASAVLLFAVPASPLAQPWPIIGGNTISALAGIVVAYLVPQPVLAASLAVAAAIIAMSLSRSLHPPGGAVALTAVLGFHSGFTDLLFPLVPVALNSAVLVGLGYAFHALMRRDYPHVPQAAPQNQHQTADIPPSQRLGVGPDDIDAALANIGEAFDIGRDDLYNLVREVERQGLSRIGSLVRCGDIMSKDVVAVSPDATTDHARELLFKHNIRTIPVVAGNGSLMGTVGLRETVGSSAAVSRVLTPAQTASITDPAIDLLPVLTEGKTHAVVILGPDKTVVGLVTQTDLLAALGSCVVMPFQP
ncbi:HPP family protein [Aureimonas fodinaquatilis]|uniref:HPP family protein n=1 Tax=Aureimonas fodinaquatilis TaxID=2565783 RepID=A0A5B0DU55_9HYPH|nr:HPP family protein [Aureimonas fodinaquatilis]KAA0969090.1 HPP family protein [Aureimonas fodinaquatilis]